MKSLERQSSIDREVDAAAIEYFVDAADDPRLEKILKQSDFSHTSFKATLNSRNEIYPQVLGNDTWVHKGDHAEFTAFATVSGSFVRDEGIESIGMEFVSDADKNDWLRVEYDEDKGHFLGYLPDGSSQQLSYRDIAQVTLNANDDFPVDFLDSLDDDPRNDELYKTLIKTIWDRAGMLGGYLNEANSLERVVYDTESMRFVHHVLEHTKHTDIEKPDTIDIHYKRIVPLPELGSEQVYHLSLKYIDAGYHMERGVRRITRSRESDDDRAKKYLLKSARITSRDEYGTIVELDPDDPEVMKLFVDSFEELLESAN